MRFASWRSVRRSGQLDQRRSTRIQPAKGIVREKVNDTTRAKFHKACKLVSTKHSLNTKSSCLAKHAYQPEYHTVTFAATGTTGIIRHFLKRHYWCCLGSTHCSWLPIYCLEILPHATRPYEATFVLTASLGWISQRVKASLLSS